jgi:hypothetical protein
MDSGSSELESQRVCVDARQRCDCHRRIGEQQPKHAPAGQLGAAQSHGGDEDLAPALEVPDHDAEPIAGWGKRDLVGLFHWLKGRDVHPLLESAGDQPLALSAARIQHVCGPLSPRGVGDLRDDAVECPLPRMHEEERDRVEADTQVARVRQHPHRPVRPPAQTSLHQVPGAVGEAIAAAGKVVAVPEASRGRAARGPEWNRIEHVRKLVEIEQRHEDPVAE